MLAKNPGHRHSRRPELLRSLGGSWLSWGNRFWRNLRTCYYLCCIRLRRLRRHRRGRVGSHYLYFRNFLELVLGRHAAAIEILIRGFFFGLFRISRYHLTPGLCTFLLRREVVSHVLICEALHVDEHLMVYQKANDRGVNASSKDSTEYLRHKGSNY